ncbi:MAG: hypothetical protein L0I76_37785, partial [Pseudonocardia sp.]|nr:hypothetical protein [Pseudonocardia sp.]
MTGTEDAQPARDVAEALAWMRNVRYPEGDVIDPEDMFGTNDWAAATRRHAATIVRAALAAGPDELHALLARCDEVFGGTVRTEWVRAALAGARPAAEPDIACKLAEIADHVQEGAIDHYRTYNLIDEEDLTESVRQLRTLAAARPAGEPDDTGTDCRPQHLRQKLREALGIDDVVTVDDGGLVADVEEWIRRARAFAPAPRPTADAPDLLTLEELTEGVELAMESSAIEVTVWETHPAETGGRWRTDRTGESTDPIRRLTRCLRSA